ncbi:glycosyltransferase family 2 protein [Litorivita sp. NS0012-18]|uniref:glycosyltransferase family 2 protein n=1 Tax=Litorivita sp. NS0012-18 TaxID=3127655 RepID=UPI003106317D
MTDSPLAVIIPANNEAGYITPCLEALLAQVSCPPMVVVVSANACTDATVPQTQAQTARFAALGHTLICIDSLEGGKTAALDRAEAVLVEMGQGAAPRVYLDADVICDTDLLGQVARALAADAPLYATGRLCVAPAQSRFTRLYARFWQSLPFVKGGAVGAGFFAVNALGRARWGGFPRIISDDTFVRLNFAPHERIEVPARYHWPMIEGFAALTRVRRRQDAGVAELAALYPELMGNEAKAPLTRTHLLHLAARMPFGFAAYMSVHLAVRLKPAGKDWSRGR